MSGSLLAKEAALGISLGRKGERLAFEKERNEEGTRGALSSSGVLTMAASQDGILGIFVLS